MGASSYVPYDKNLDYSRRLLQLKTYLIIKKIYIDAQIGIQETNKTDKSNEKEIIPPFNSHTNYLQRMHELLIYLAKNKKIDINAPEKFKENIINKTGADINGLIPTNSPSVPSSANNKNNSIFSESSSQLGSDQLSSGSSKQPSQSDVVNAVNTSYKNKIRSQEGAENNKANNEANQNLPLESLPSKTSEKIRQPYVPSNKAPSLYSLQDKNGTNSLLKGTDTEKQKLRDGISAIDLSNYQLYMQQRLTALKAYFEIQNNIDNLYN